MHICTDPKELGLISMITLVVHSENPEDIPGIIEIIHSEYGEYITCITHDNIEVIQEDSVNSKDDLINYYEYYLLSLNKAILKLDFPDKSSFIIDRCDSHEQAVVKACRKIIEFYHGRK